MKGFFINMILNPFEAIQADSFWYIIAFENFKRYFLRLLIHRQLHNFSGRRSWVLTLISMHPDVPMSLRLWVVTLWKPRTDLVVSHSLHLGSSCHLSKTAVCLYCGNLWDVCCTSHTWAFTTLKGIHHREWMIPNRKINVPICHLKIYFFGDFILLTFKNLLPGSNL